MTRLGGPLVGLSLQRVSRLRVPHAPTNDERLRAYREFMPVQFGSPLLMARLDEARQAREYQMAEMLDGRERTTDVHYMETI